VSHSPHLPAKATSLTRCAGATLGVALMNFDFRTINGRQVLKIFFGWVITLPCAVSHPILPCSRSSELTFRFLLAPGSFGWTHNGNGIERPYVGTPLIPLHISDFVVKTVGHEAERLKIDNLNILNRYYDVLFISLPVHLA
jgi:hypothetical protein